MNELEDRIPPHSDESEESILASLLVAGDQTYRVSDVLQPAHFYRPERRIIYQAMLDLAKEGIDIDTLTLAEQLRSQGNLEKIGGIVRLADIAARCSTASNLEWVADKVIETAKARALIKTCNDTLRNVYSCNTEDLPDLLGKTQQEIAKIGAAHIGDAPRPLSAIVPGVYEEIVEKSEAGVEHAGMSTGFRDLDEITNGLSKGEFVVVAGRPAMGKTSLAMQVAQYVTRQGKPVLVFSLEMSKERLVLRMMSAQSGIDNADLSRGKVTTSGGWDCIQQAVEDLSHDLMYICDPSFASCNDISAKANRLRAETGDLGLIVIDYIQLMHGQSKKNDPNRNNEVSEITRALKCLAMAMDCPIVALSQLSRAVELRNNKRPQLSDLRDSGSIEADADQVWFVYRDEYYNEYSDRRGEAEIIVAKNRSGPTGTAYLLFDSARTQFKNK